MNNYEVQDRARGALVGLAVGDALGTTLEFKKREPEKKARHTEMIGGGPFNLLPGEWTDDTSMALALAETILRRGTVDYDDLMGRFAAWYTEGKYSSNGMCFDIGNTCRYSIERWITGKRQRGPVRNRAPTNGSIMRLAPVPIFALGDIKLCRSLAAEQSRATHKNVMCTQACQYLAEVLHDLILTGQRYPAMRARHLHKAETPIHEIAEGWYASKTRREIKSTGYVADTLEAALWAVYKTTTFEDAVALAVNLGDDADTVGAVTGQIAGALYGVNSIPTRWFNRLHDGIGIIKVADDLFTARRG